MDRKEPVWMVAENASDGELVIGIDCCPYSQKKEQLDYKIIKKRNSILKG